MPLDVLEMTLNPLEQVDADQFELFQMKIVEVNYSTCPLVDDKPVVEHFLHDFHQKTIDQDEASID